MIELKNNSNPSAILDMDATAIAEQIRNRSIRSVDAVNIYIKAILTINPVLNCVIEDRFEAALAEAEEMDHLLDQGVVYAGRLAGVPISMKECLDVSGMKTTGGLRSRKNHQSTDDAHIVHLLKNEGAIIIGKTNTAAMCFYQETDNKLFGRTNNPWNTARTAGGSSGGEAALVASGGAAVGIGSDIGGSIRIPSHFNGTVGFKSSYGKISYEGGFPEVTIPLQKRMLGVGAIAKSVRDAKLINEVLSEKIPDNQDLHSYEIILPLGQINYPISSKTRTLLMDIRDFLQKSFPVSDQKPPYYQASALMWQLIMSIDGANDIARTAFSHPKPPIWKEYVKEKLLRVSDHHRFLTWALIGAKWLQPKKEQLEEIEKTIEQGNTLVEEFFHQSLLVLPVYHSAAPKHGQVFKELFSPRRTFQTFMPFTAYANVWGLPSLTVPVGEDREGMPIAVQIISSPKNENAIFQLGELLENQFRGYVRCSYRNDKETIIYE
ncbi:amidase [Bacillus sp. 1P06AnD]|uniref:amidase n=1 Tax=Bacillus sp. 1P06AnD TaxID=3132208 RepID=UPI0039A258FC